jgi:hypothetical protein
MTEKMVMKKYDPVARKHVEYKGKISKIRDLSTDQRPRSNARLFCVNSEDS